MRPATPASSSVLAESTGCAVITTMGVSAQSGCVLTVLMTSKPSILGIRRSSSITSGSRFSIAAIASVPS